MDGSTSNMDDTLNSTDIQSSTLGFYKKVMDNNNELPNENIAVKRK